MKLRLIKNKHLIKLSYTFDFPISNSKAKMLFSLSQRTVIAKIILGNLSVKVQFVGHLHGDSIVGLMATFSKRTYAIHYASQVCCSQSPYTWGRSPLSQFFCSRYSNTLKAGLTQFLVEVAAPFPGFW